MWVARLKTGDGQRRLRIGKDIVIYVQKVGDSRTVLAIEANGLQITHESGPPVQGIEDSPPDVVGV